MKGAGIRTCLGCRGRKHKRELLRFSVDSSGMLVFDERMRLQGRGAYCCDTEQCLRGMLRNRRALARTLRCGDLRWDAALMLMTGTKDRKQSLAKGREDNEAGVGDGKNQGA